MRSVSVTVVTLLLLACFTLEAAAASSNHLSLLERRMRRRAHVRARVEPGDFEGSIFTQIAYSGQGADKYAFSSLVNKGKEKKFELASGLLDTLDGKHVALLCEKTAESGVLQNEKDGLKLLETEGIGTNPVLLQYYGEFKAACINSDRAVFSEGKKCEWLVTELLPGRDLDKAALEESFDAIRDDAAKFRDLVKKALTAVAVLHNKKIVHGDVNARNLRVVMGDVPSVKLFDFAATKKLGDVAFASDSNEDTYSFGKEILGFMAKKASLKPWNPLPAQVAGSQLAEDAADKCAFKFLQACLVKGTNAHTLLSHKYFDGKDHSANCD